MKQANLRDITHIILTKQLLSQQKFVWLSKIFFINMNFVSQITFYFIKR